MDFIYVIIFHTQNGLEIRREGKGLFFPHDKYVVAQWGEFNIEDMLWKMTEEYGRPDSIEVHMDFSAPLSLLIPSKG